MDLIDTDRWNRMLEKIGAQTSAWILLDSGLNKSKKEFSTGKGVNWTEVRKLRKTWRSDYPFIDSDGNPFVLYIYDQVGHTYHSEWHYYNNGPREYKFHFCWCSTLEKMSAIGRRARYKAKHNIENNIFIVNRGHGSDEEIKMNVCRNCLNQMDYENYSTSYRVKKDKIHNEFNIKLFFEEHTPQHLLRPSHPFHTGRYVNDWQSVRREIINLRGNKCEECESVTNLQVHHKNGVKDDNRPSNLEVLCKTCHSMQPMHEHMR